MQAQPPVRVTNLFEDLKDGTKLLTLLEVLSGEKLVRKLLKYEIQSNFSNTFIMKIM